MAGWDENLGCDQGAERAGTSERRDDRPQGERAVSRRRTKAGRAALPADLSSTGKKRIAEEYSVNLGISSWEIDFFGRIRSLKERALEEYLATEQARRI